jgi:hypothetical protein
MDVSFKAVRPYCVIGNSGAPLGLIVAPTEKAWSYHMFYDTLAQKEPSLAPILGQF